MIGLKLKDFQEKAVDFLFDKTTDIKSKRRILLQSPTGSGKTIILIGYVERYLNYKGDDIICWFCPGKGELEEQSKEKMEKFAPNLKTGDIFDILNNGFEQGTSYFINWETITKKDNKAIRESERKNLFERIKEAHNQNLKFIVIIDEEHQNNTLKVKDILDSISAEYEIRVSATPNKRIVGEFHEILETDVINEELITKAMYINEDLENIELKNFEHETMILLEKADEKRKNILQEYKNENEDINPLVLIQFPNLNDELIEKVERKLEEMGYSYDNGLVASWFSADTKEDKKRKSKKLGKINIGNSVEESITKNNAKPVFLLFKQALSTGWDCPRAKVLVKLRENMNETFEIQTLGRLRRMPKAKHYGKEILDCSYLYTFDEEYKRSVIAAKEGFETKRLFLKKEPKSIRLKKEIKNLDGNYVDEKLVRNKIFEYLKEKYKLTTSKIENRKKLSNYGFEIGTLLKREYLSGRFRTYDEISETIAGYHEIDIEVNTHNHGIERQHNIDRLKKILGLSYEKTSQLLQQLFYKDFKNSKYNLLNLDLREFYAFIINNADILKNDFLEFDGKISHQFQIPNIKTVEFFIPEEEHYKFVPFEKNIRIYDSNVYEKYDTSMITEDFRSKSERLFEKYCENNPKVKYVYKNGDSGQQYLSIVYTTNMGKQRSFYPDYIVQLNNDKIWLIETKGGESKGQDKNIDEYVENKFLALKYFSEKYGYNFGFVRDKDEELYFNNTKYEKELSKDNWKFIDEIFDEM
jgi:type III restriction protein res subunit